MQKKKEATKKAKPVKLAKAEADELYERMRARYPEGKLVRYNIGHGWYHARIKRIERSAAFVTELSGGNAHRVDFASLDEPVFYSGVAETYGSVV